MHGERTGYGGRLAVIPEGGHPRVGVRLTVASVARERSATRRSWAAQQRRLSARHHSVAFTALVPGGCMRTLKDAALRCFSAAYSALRYGLSSAA